MREGNAAHAQRQQGQGVATNHQQSTGATVGRNARSVPLKGIHRLFSEAEQVRFIVARVHVGGTGIVVVAAEKAHTQTLIVTLGTGSQDIA
jgi:hypothetical protein